MNTELLEIQPRELKFVFELRKQSSCSLQLFSNSDQYVAFKVKTTSPKRYCVRPNTGIIKPKGTCDFTVTMQAQRVAPPDMQCKDKFLIQSTVVPFGTTELDITSEMFAKDSGKYIEERKLRVVLISPPDSPVLLPINKMLKQDPCYETSMQKDKVLSGVENIPPPDKVAKDEGLKTVKDTDEFKAAKDVETRPDEDVVALPNEDVEEVKSAKNVTDLKLAEDFAELKFKLNEAELTITKLTEDRTMATREKEMLKQELALLRQKNGVRRVQVGFPFLFVCMVSLISVVVGYLMHP